MRPKQLPSRLETDLILASFCALGAINMSDPDALAAFDKLTSKGEPISYRDIAHEYDSQLLARIHAIVVGGYLMNWQRGGATALVTLREWVHNFPPEQADIEFQILSRTLDLARVLADWSVAGKQEPDDALLMNMAELAGSFARFMCEHNHPGPAGELATFAVRLRKWASTPDDPSLMRFALRMMDKTKKQVFVPLIPRAKYPPPRQTGVPPDVLLQLVCRVISSIFLDFRKNPQPRSRTRVRLERLYSIFNGFHKNREPGAGIASVEDFNNVVQLMFEDRDHVAFVNGQFQYQYPDKPVTDSSVKRVEVRFSPPLLKRINELLAAAPGTSVTPYNLLIDLIAQLLTNKDSMEWRHDEYLFDWFVLRGAEPYREGSFFQDGVLFVTSTATTVTVTIGETESDIDPWVRYGFLAEKSREFLRLAKSRLG